MTVVIFLIILSVLVFVHEMGHFLAAKWAGVRVDEFGFGYPPRAWKMFRKWNTDFTLNWIPFGGFVKIFGENPEGAGKEENLSGSAHFAAQNTAKFPSDSAPAKKFTDVSKKWQTVILAAGVLFNILFAWLLLSLGFMLVFIYHFRPLNN